ncbi:atp-dependent rna helicase mss116 [Neofusicoccum parvum]|nr:atp-dependent rna helicase mss116 [Neofusicoccum parvum]
MLQNIIAKDPSLATPRMAGRMGRWPRVRPDIRAIIISPTRELAEQIAVEARKLTRHTSIAVQTAVGGTGKRDGMRRIMTEGCNILVATPGRLNDILGDEFAPIPAENLDYLIFDEADRLLEAGFWEEITSIQEKLPNREVRDRQTLMFSATVPKEVVRLVRQALKPGFHFVKTVREDEEPTHQRVPQKAVICSGLETQLPALLELCQREATLAKAGEKRPFKAIVYFNTLKEVELGYSSFKEIRRNQRRQHDVWESDLLFIHSGLTQSGRQRMADTFRASESAILFSTDVTARGMDFPNVTHVIQLGISRDPADYIHRIGRTGRAGKEGEGWLLLPQFNRQAIQQKLGHLPIKIDSSLETAKADIHNLSSLPEHSAKIITDVQDGFKELDRQDLIESFNGILGAYQGTRDKQSVLDSMNTMATQLWGLDRAPKVYGRLGESFGQGRGSGRGRSDAPFDRRSRNSQNSRSGFQNNRSGFQNDRSGFQSGRSGYQNDRSGFQSGRSDFQNDRSGSQNDRSGRRPFAGRPQGGFNTGKEFSRGGGYEKRRQRETGW